MRRSNVANAVPGGADLNEGELAINTMDGALYFKKSNGTIITGHDDTILHIDSTNSRVGIGTDSPAFALSVDAGTSDYPGHFKSTDNKAALIIADDDTTVYVSAENSRGSFGFNPGVNAANLNINSSGHLGLGIVSPSNLLHIHATGNGSSALIVEDDARRLELGRDMIQAKSSDGSTVQNLYIQPAGNTAFATNSGKVGIGITGPSATLHVQNTSTNGEVMRLTTTGDDPDRHMYFQSDHIYGSGNMYFGTGAYVNLFRASSHRFYYGTSNTEAMRVHTNGNVGIGATAPTSKLEVHGSVGTIPDTTNSSLQLRDTSAVGANNGGSIVFSGIYTGSSGFLGSGPYIKAYKLNATDGDYSYGLKFATRQNGVGSQAIGLTITPDQKVGIGTSSPTKTLHVNGQAQLENNLVLNENTPAIVTPNGDLRLFTGGAESMRLDSNGKVGIGTNSPKSLLNVRGTGADGGILTLENDSTSLVTDRKVGQIHFYSNDGSTNGAGVKADIKAIAENSIGSEIGLAFGTSGTGSATAVEAMRINSSGNTIFGGTSVGAAGALSVKVDGSYTDLYLYGAGTSQGGRIFFGDSSDRSSIVGTYGTGGGGKLSFKTDTTGGTSQDRLVIDSDGSIRFNNAFTFPTSIGSAGQVLKVPTTGTSLIWGNASGGGGGSSIEDNDGDTKIQVEESADEDIIRFDIAGTQKMSLSSTHLDLTGNLQVSGDLNIAGDINSTSVTNLDVTDKTITMANNAGSSNAADGAGIIIEGPSSNASLLWDHTNQYLEFNKAVFSPTGFIIGTTATNVGRMYNSAGVMALEAYTTRQISFGNATNGEHVRIDADGKVGIGTTNPNANLHVGSSVSMGSQSNPAIQIGATDNYRFGVYTGNEDAIIENKNGDDGIAFRVKTAGEAMRIDGGTGNVGIGTTAPTDPLVVQSSGASMGGGATLTNSYFTITDGTTSMFHDPNELFSNINGSFHIGATHANGLLRFQTGGTSTRMVILANGNVGIGTSTPSEKLHVTDTVFIDYPDGNGSSLKIGRNDSSNYWEVNHAGADFRLYNTAGSGNDILFSLDPSGSDQGNKVGIGTATPDKKLTVDGDVKVGNGDAFMSANVAGSTRSLISLGTDNVLRIKGNDSEGSNNVISMINGGDVGIGTTSPSDKLHVYENVNRTTIKAENNNHSAKFEAYGTATAIDTDASNGIIIRQSGSNTAHFDNTGNVGINKIDPKAKFQVEEYGIDTTETSTSATTQVAIHTFPIADFRSARFTIQITNTTDSTYHSTEILAIHDGTTANITEFGEVHTGSSVEATFDADISSSNFRLLATPSSTNSMEFKVVCHSLTV